MKIAIIDDNSFLINSIKEKLSFFEEIQVKFTATDGEDLLKKLEKNSTIDALLMDIEMPKMNGIEATFQVKNKFPHIKIIMLTVFDNDENIFNAIKAGADGYLLKEVTAYELHNAILETLNGGAVMTPSIALKTLRLFRDPSSVLILQNQEDYKLSEREIEVLEQLSKGLKYDAIASNLILSSGTIRKHVENIYFKLKVHNKLEAVQKARDNKLI
jgi:DNA-binding NarL/FixJ family response regulator